MIILHGENTIQSRNRLTQLIAAAKAKNQVVVRVDAKQLDLATLEQKLGEQSLFGDPQIFIIEELHSLPKSKKKEELLSYLATHGHDAVVLWEKHDLTPTMLKKFSQVRAEHFKISKVLFEWLDTLSGKRTPQLLTRILTLFRQALEQDDAFLCLSMLVRQVRLLIQAKEGSTQGMAPFLANKLQRQAQSFSLPQLLKAHHALLLLDLAEKTSSSRLNLARELELFLVTL